MDYQAFTNDSLTMMYEAVQGRAGGRRRVEASVYSNPIPRSSNAGMVKACRRSRA